MHKLNPKKALKSIYSSSSKKIVRMDKQDEDKEFIERPEVQEFLNRFGIKSDHNSPSTLRRFYEQEKLGRGKNGKYILKSKADRVVMVRSKEYAQKLQVDRLMKKAQIPSRFLDKSLDNFKPLTGIQEKILKKCINFVEDFCEDTTRGILIIGDKGRGKSHLLSAVLQEIIKRYQVSGRYCDITEVYDEARLTFDINSQITLKSVLEPIMDVRLLFMDDMGTDKLTEWTVKTFHKIINHRYLQQMPTLIASNLTEDKFFERIDYDKAMVDKAEKAWSRLHEMMEFYKIDGPDYRRLGN